MILPLSVVLGVGRGGIADAPVRFNDSLVAIEEHHSIGRLGERKRRQ